jgi:hypothetical protein
MALVPMTSPNLILGTNRITILGYPIYFASSVRSNIGINVDPSEVQEVE